MAEFRAVKDIYLNVDSRGRVDTTNQDINLPDFVEWYGTQALYRFHLQYADGTAYPLPAGSTFYFGVDSSFTASHADYVTSSGADFNNSDWAEESLTNGLVSARINFATSELRTYLSTSEEKTVTMELWFQPPGGSFVLLAQWSATIKNIVTDYAGATANPLPEYVTTTAQAAAIAAFLIRDENGDVWVVDANGQPVNKLT